MYSAPPLSLHLFAANVNVEVFSCKIILDRPYIAIAPPLTPVLPMKSNLSQTLADDPSRSNAE